MMGQCDFSFNVHETGILKSTTHMHAHTHTHTTNTQNTNHVHTPHPHPQMEGPHLPPSPVAPPSSDDWSTRSHLPSELEPPYLQKGARPEKKRSQPHSEALLCLLKGTGLTAVGGGRETSKERCVLLWWWTKCSHTFQTCEKGQLSDGSFTPSWNLANVQPDGLALENTGACIWSKRRQGFHLF